MMTPSKSASLSVVPKHIQKRVTYQPTSAILWWWYEAPAIELQASHFPESLKLAPMFRLLMVQLKAWVLQQNTISCNENIRFSETIFLENSPISLHIFSCDPHVMSLQKHLLEWMCQLAQHPMIQLEELFWYASARHPERPVQGEDVTCKVCT